MLGDTFILSKVLILPLRIAMLEEVFSLSAYVTFTNDDYGVDFDVLTADIDVGTFLQNQILGAFHPA